MDATDCRLVACVSEWPFGEVLLDVRPKPADNRSSSFRPVMKMKNASFFIAIPPKSS